jgi:Tfp pilus assembly protein PilP
VLLQIASVKEKAVSLLALANNKNLPELPIDEKNPPTVANGNQLETQVPERDPFVPSYSVVAKENPSHLAPLTSYELSQLRVSAIIGDSDGNRMASVETVSGGIFIVRPGTPVGKNGGTVRAITGRSVVIAEPTSGILSTTSKASVTEITLTKSQL